MGLNLFPIILFGYDNVWLRFFVFHFAQVVLSTLGVKKILNFTAYAGGMIPTQLILAGLGMVVYKMSGIWSPVDLFVKYVPNLFIVIIAMAFIILGSSPPACSPTSSPPT